MNQALHDIGKLLGLDVSGAHCNQLLDYLSLLERWNKTYNLTAVRDPAQMLHQHLADCLAVVMPLRRHFLAHSSSARRVLDVGSGGGLPGVVLAVMNPDLNVTCVDAVGKKAAFVRQVASELQLKNLNAEHCRVEQLQAAPFNVITSRAFASLADFVHCTLPLQASSGVWLAMKGKVPEAEIAELSSPTQVFHVEQLQVPGLQAERCLVWMRQAEPNEGEAFL
jgi:16S rRNA (guanine527-N7)-methyltransferase